MKLEKDPSNLEKAIKTCCIIVGSKIPSGIREAAARRIVNLYFDHPQIPEKVLPDLRASRENLTFSMELIANIRRERYGTAEQAGSLARETSLNLVTHNSRTLDILNHCQNDSIFPVFEIIDVHPDSADFLKSGKPFMGVGLHSAHDFGSLGSLNLLFQSTTPKELLVVVSPQVKILADAIGNLMKDKKITTVKATDKRLGKALKNYLTNQNRGAILHIDKPPLDHKDGITAVLLENEASFPTTPVTRARRYQVPMIPFFTYSIDKKKAGAVIGYPVFPQDSDRETMQLVCDQITPWIIEHPTDVFAFSERVHIRH